MKLSQGMASIILAALCAPGCDIASDNKIPVDLKERLPPLEELAFSIPGTAGAAGTASDLVHQELENANRAMSGLDLIDEYFEEGGIPDRGVSIIIALEGAPRVVDQLTRYTRDNSRLDVGRIGDHVEMYLQYDQGRGFDPNESIGEGAMLVEGSTVIPAAYGQRAAISQAKGLANVNQGYLRFHFNHRPGDHDPLRTAAQLDYRFGEEQDSLHLTFFPRADAADSEAVLGLWLLRLASGAGLIYVSQQSEGKMSYKMLAQYDAGGGLAVWDGEGMVWGCYDKGGAEIGNADNPTPCESFQEPFAAPPGGPGIWPGLPGGVPQ